MIKSFTIKDYKSYDTNGVLIDFLCEESNKYRPVNIFYGSNGSGKSTIKEYLLKHPELTEGEKILWFDEKFVKERFDNYLGMSAVSSGISDDDERRQAETEINRLETVKESFSIAETNVEVDVPKVVRGRELVFSGVYDERINNSTYKDFFSFEKELYKGLDKRQLTGDEINRLQSFVSAFREDIDSFATEEIRKTFLKELCDFNLHILNQCPDLLTCSVPCFYLYFSLTCKLEETREMNLLPKNYHANNAFFETIDNNKIATFFNTFSDKIRKSIDDKVANLNLLKNFKDPEYVANKINTYLSSYGFFDIKLEVANNKQRTVFLIKRTFSDDIKNNFATLSEGEKHLLAFLYFYEQCLGFDDFSEASNPKNRILLIDDPVTSMDANVLYLVSRLVADLFAFNRNSNGIVLSGDTYQLKHDLIKQVMVFTHNAYFLRVLITNGMKFSKKYMTLHHVYKIIKDGKYVSKLKYLTSFKDEYSLLWDTYFELKNDNSENITFLMPNICRRILESYGKFEGLDDSDSASRIIDRLSTELPGNLSNEEIMIYKSMINCLNNGSHYISATDDVYMQFRQIDYAAIFEKLFLELDERHYRLKERQFINSR